MTEAQLFISRHLRISASLLVFGLVVEAISLFWSHPTAFLLFAGVGGLSIFLGITIFLWALVATPSVPDLPES